MHLKSYKHSEIIYFFLIKQNYKNKFVLIAIFFIYHYIYIIYFFLYKQHSVQIK